MLVSCVICSELFDSTSDVYVTPCGHLFHYVCLLGWLERSKTCPQCRSETTEDVIVRVYFNVQSDETEDAGSLQNQIDSLKLSVRRKEQELNTANEGRRMLRLKVDELQRSSLAAHQEMLSLRADNKSKALALKMLQEDQRYLTENKCLARNLRGAGQADVSQSASPHSSALRRLLVESSVPNRSTLAGTSLDHRENMPDDGEFPRRRTGSRQFSTLPSFLNISPRRSRPSRDTRRTSTITSEDNYYECLLNRIGVEDSPVPVARARPVSREASLRRMSLMITRNGFMDFT